MVKRFSLFGLAAIALFGAALVLDSRGASADPAGPYRAYVAQVAADRPILDPTPPLPPTISPRAGIPFPNPVLTPGDVLTRDVPTICTVGYTTTVRDVSDVIKEQVYDSYGLFNHAPGAYEIDHLVSLELGGSNDVRNLWPEPYDDPNGARVKDVLENKMHDLVCAGRLDISEAQQEIATDWYGAYLLYVSPNGAPTRTPTPVGTFTTPSVTTTATSTPTPTPVADDKGPWYTSSFSTSTYYYCAADPGWQGLSPTYLRSYPTEAALLVDWAGRRVKHAYPGC